MADAEPRYPYLPKGEQSPDLLMATQSSVETVDLAAKLKELTRPTGEIGESLLASASYDGDTRKAILKFYDQKAGRFWLWEDNTGHRPYCFTRLTLDELEAVSRRKDVVGIEEVERLDLLNDTTAKLRKIITTDPLAIGGGNDSIRDMIKAWEADIKYYENFAYDRGLRMGTYYRVSQGKVIPVTHDVPERVNRSLEDVTRRNPKEFQPYLRDWAELLGEPLVDFRRVALDIEVDNEEGRLPDVEDPKQPVIAVSFFNEAEKVVYLLKGEREEKGLEESPFEHRVFEKEADLLRAVFSKIMDYPVILSFNGDDFDLRYLQHRAERLGITEQEDPIQLERVAAALKHGIHIDLYQFFRNRSIQVYAFGNRYTEHTLNAIAETLLNKSKIEFAGEIGDLPLAELGRYCLNDSQLTYELTSMMGSVVMKLLLVISRIGKMPMNDVSRLGVSNWIRSLLFFEHRKIGALIPRQDELTEKGGGSTQAIIKGKKYKGGFVIEPKPGVYFDVPVLDFASLYPSLIKVHNLSYETVNCPHEECKANRIPDTSSWVCTKRKGIVSLVTGSLRDLRVAHYKPLTKDPTLSKEDRELYNVVSQGLKVFLNASYGVLGFETFAFYCLPVAEGTAALGRDAITRTIAKSKELGIEVLYGDSVTGDRCVALRDPSGVFRVLPIEEFFSLVGVCESRPDGKEEAHPANWSALSVNPATGRVAFKPVLAVIRHQNRKRVFRVRERWGVTRVTEDHSLLARTTKGLVFAKPTELEGLKTVRVGTVPDLKPIEDIDLFEEIKDVTFESVYKGREKTSTVKCDENWVWFGWTNQENPIRVKRRYHVGTPEFDALLDLLAAYVPEGSSSTPETTLSRVGASIANSDTEWLAHLRRCYLFLFDRARASVIRSTHGERRLIYPTQSGMVETFYEDKTYKLQMMNQISAVVFKSLGGQGSKAKQIPSFVFHLSPDYKRRFLSGLIKGDGSKWPDRRYSKDYLEKNFRYESASLRLVSGLSLLLTSLGVNHVVNYRPSKDTYKITTSTKYNSRDTLSVTREDYAGYVYDLSVADYHTFVDACGGIVLKNTDSLFLHSPSKEQIGTVTRWADTDLGVELDLDKTYRYVAFSSRKKNYFGVLPDGTVDIRGLTGKKSVHGSTPMLARFDDKVQLTTVADVYERFRTGRSVEVLSVVDELRTIWVPISDAMKHEVSDVYKVVTSKGRELVLSGDHSVYLIDTFGRLHHKDTRLLRPGDVVVGAQYVPPRVPSMTLPVLHYLVSPVRLQDGLAYPGRLHATAGVPVPCKLPMCEELATILGIYVAEGNTSPDRRSRNNSITQSRILNPEVCSEIERAWPILFQAPVKVYRKRGGINAYYLPKLHAELFEQLCGGSSGEKRVPPMVFDADNRFVARFLRAVFSGDGYGDGKRVNLASKSRALVTGVAYLLARFDIDARLRRFRVKGKTYYQLSIIGASSRREFYLQVGFMQPRFNKPVGTKARNKELFPISTAGLLSVKEEMLKRKGKSNTEGVNMHDLRHYNLSMLDHYNAVLGKLIQMADTTEEREKLRSIATMLNVRDVSFDEITAVRKIQGKAPMYDFTVPGLERFVAGNLPTLLHNSQTPEYLKKSFYGTLEILSSVMTAEDFERARARTKELLTKMLSDLKGKKVPVSDLAFTVMMGKPTDKYNGTTPQHVRAAKQLEERGKEIKAGEIIAYVKTKNPPYVKPAELARSDEVDADKYIEYAHSMFDQLLDALDFSFDEIMGATTLDLFWGS